MAEPTPTLSSVTTFAPETIANLGLGFDFLGCAVDGLSSFVSLFVDPTVHPGELSISSTGKYASKLSSDLLLNCAGISALVAMKLLKIRSEPLALYPEGPPSRVGSQFLHRIRRRWSGPYSPNSSLSMPGSNQNHIKGFRLARGQH